MYIEIHNHADFEQKTLYFKLNNAFNMDMENELNQKLQGIYAIYSNNICLYVGQSKNLASRIATHIRGKYEKSTEIYLWNIEDIGFNDFLRRSKAIQQSILDNSEKLYMQKLKPIDNVNIDMDFKLNEDESALLTNPSIILSLQFHALRITDNVSNIQEEIEISVDYLHKEKEISDKQHTKIKSILKEYELIFKGGFNENR